MKDQFVCVEQFVCVSKGKIYSYEWEIGRRKCWSSEGWEEMMFKQGWGGNAGEGIGRGGERCSRKCFIN